MASWENARFKNVGFTFGDLIRAARKQHTPETCWAAALAMASALLKRPEWNNEIKWYHIGLRAGLVMEKSTRISPVNLVKLVKNIQDFTANIYTIEQVAPIIGSALTNDSVILLMSEEHVVVLGQLQLAKENKENMGLTYHVIDSAVGEAEVWSQERFNNFKPEYAAVISR